MDIAATVNPATVHFRSSHRSGKTRRHRAELRIRFAGARQTAEQICRQGSDPGAHLPWTTTPPSTKRSKAILLANNNGPVWRIGNEIVTGLSSDGYRFPEVPANLYDRPTLLMSLENSGARKQSIETSYLGQQFVLDGRLCAHRYPRRPKPPISTAGHPRQQFRHGISQCQASARRRDLNRLPERTVARKMEAMALTGADKGQSAFQQESFSEYHLYSLAGVHLLRTRRPSRSACCRAAASRWKNSSSSMARTTTITTPRIRARPLRIPSWSSTNSR